VCILDRSKKKLFVSSTSVLVLREYQEVGSLLDDFLHQCF